MKAYNTGASVLPSNNAVMSEKERTNVIVCAFNIAMTIAGTSIGGLIAAGLDYVDGKYNGYVSG